MMKSRIFAYLISISVVFIASCIERNNSILSQNGYPSIIKSLELQKPFNEIKWRLYCIHCDEKVEFVDPEIKDKITFGMLDLRFDTIDTLGEGKNRDTIEVLFNFYYNDTICEYDYIKNLIYYGARVIDKTKQIYCYSTKRDFTCVRDSCIDHPDCGSRLINPLQPEVISYIKNNQEKLAPWFKEEAKRRKVIN